MMQKNWKMTETFAHGYTSEDTQRGLSNEYQRDKVSMVFKNLCPCALDESSLSIGRVNLLIVHLMTIGIAGADPGFYWRVWVFTLSFAVDHQVVGGISSEVYHKGGFVPSFVVDHQVVGGISSEVDRKGGFVPSFEVDHQVVEGKTLGLNITLATVQIKHYIWCKWILRAILH